MSGSKIDPILLSVYARTFKSITEAWPHAAECSAKHVHKAGSQCR